MIDRNSIRILQKRFVTQYVRGFLGISLILYFLYSQDASMEGQSFLKHLWCSFTVTIFTLGIANWRLLQDFEKEQNHD
jgi:hypothetical protein